MLSQHPIDRFGRYFRVPIMVGAVLLAPVAVYVYAAAIAQYLMPLPTWMMLIGALSQILLIAGFASLFDIRQEKAQMTRTD